MSERAWEWAPGMLVRATVEGDPALYRLDGADEGLYKESWILVHESRIYDDTDDVVIDGPVTTDPATLGALLGQVREAWGLPYAHAIGYLISVGEKDPETGDRAVAICWRVEPGPYTEDHPGWQSVPHILGRGPTEWDALCAALAAAPGRKE